VVGVVFVFCWGFFVDVIEEVGGGGGLVCDVLVGQKPVIY